MALEVDSREFHLSPDDWEKTLRHHNRLAKAGILVLHFTPAQIRDDPGRVLREIEAAYMDRGTPANSAYLSKAEAKSARSAGSSITSPEGRTMRRQKPAS